MSMLMYKSLRTMVFVSRLFEVTLGNSSVEITRLATKESYSTPNRGAILQCSCQSINAS